MMLSRHNKFSATLVVIVCLLVSNACSDTDDSATQRIWYQPLETERPTAKQIPPVEPPASKEEIESFQQIFRGVEAAPSQLFERPDIEKWANYIERIYLRAGRYLELVGLYQQVVEKLGVDSRAGPRLAWLYVRLGQRHLAGPLIEELEQTRPDDAAVYFVKGSFWFNRSGDSRQAASRALSAWQKTLELDPEFSGFGPFESKSLRQQITRLKRRLNR